MVHFNYLGWRGDQGYGNTSPLYPGVIVGPGDGINHDMFSLLTQETFRVKVIGPDPGTAWEYKVRCHVAKSERAQNLFDEKKEV